MVRILNKTYWSKDMNFEPINLDNLTNDPNDLVAIAEVFNAYRLYALRKADAIRLRKSGRMEWAHEEERAGDKIYDSLPQFAKW